MEMGHVEQDRGWQVSNFGQISEVNLVVEEKKITYILIFTGDTQGEVFSEKISQYLHSLSVPLDCEGFEEYLRKLNCRLILKPADLALVAESEMTQIPKFYKQAVRAGETWIVQF